MERKMTFLVLALVVMMLVFAITAKMTVNASTSAEQAKILENLKKEEQKNEEQKTIEMPSEKQEALKINDDITQDEQECEEIPFKEIAN